MKIYTFESFWAKFYYITKQYKTNKQQARKLWDKTINSHLKRKAFYNINKNINVNAFEFLKKEFEIVK